MKLIVGLGNPGEVYSGNRHNAGFLALNHFARRHGIKLDRKMELARVGQGSVDGVEVILAKPQTHMNLSGGPVMRLAKKFKVKPEDIIVLQDDLDILPGRIQLRRGGNPGGHNGIISVIQELGSLDFIRIRIGIGRPQAEDDEYPPDIKEYVLSDFSPEEAEVMEKSVASASAAIDAILAEGLEKAGNRFNHRQSVASDREEKI